MTCAHGKGPADRCSQCLGITPRRVHVIDHRLCIDGQPTDRDWNEPRVVTARRRRKR